MTGKNFRIILLFCLSFALLPLLFACGNAENGNPEVSHEPTPIPTPEPMPSDFTDKPSDYYTELYRQQLHFSPSKGWMNDPNGLVYYNGEYHLFYQWTKDSPAGGWPEWGHAVSTDLIHWDDLGIAIPATNDSQIWSGSCVIDTDNSSGLFGETGEGLVAIYTRLKNGQEQCIAYSSDNGRTWTKYNNGEPVLTIKEDPLGRKDGFRDPKVFRHEESGLWVMCVAGDAVRIYTSPDLIHWTFQISYESDQIIDGKNVKSFYSECPDLFKMKVEGSNTEKWVLSLGGVWYSVGDFRNVDGKWVFIPDSNELIKMNNGEDAYAGQTFYNAPDGKRILMNWMSNVQNGPKQLEWTPKQCGSMTIPTELTLVETNDGFRLRQKPAVQYDSLLMNYYKEASAKETAKGLLEDFSADMYKLELNVTDGRVSAELFGGDVVISYSTRTNKLVVDRSKTGFGGKYETDIPSANGKMDLTIYVDTASVEIFAGNGLYTLSYLIYGSLERGVSVSYSGDGDLYAKAQKMNSIWRDLRWTNVEPAPLELTDASLCISKTTVILTADPRLFTDTEYEWEIVSGGENAKIVSTSGPSAAVEGLAEGDFTLRVTRGNESSEKTYSCRSYNFRTNIDKFTASGGEWTLHESDGLKATAGGDGFYIGNVKTDRDFDYTIRFTDETAVAVGIVLGAADPNTPNADSYVINFDHNAKNFRIFRFRNGATDVVSKTFKKAGIVPEKGIEHTILITSRDGKISYTIDGVNVFTDIDVDVSGGFAGVMVYSGKAVFRDITLEYTDKGVH